MFKATDAKALTIDHYRRTQDQAKAAGVMLDLVTTAIKDAAEKGQGTIWYSTKGVASAIVAPVVATLKEGSYEVIPCGPKTIDGDSTLQVSWINA